MRQGDWPKRQERRAPPPNRPRAPNAGGHGGDGTAQRTEGGDDIPRGPSEEGRKADAVMTERAPPERPRALNASGKEGGDGREGIPAQRRDTTARSEEEGGGTREDRRGDPPQGGPPEPGGVPWRGHGAWGPQGRTTMRSPTEPQPAPNVSGRRGKKGGGEPPDQQRSPESRISGTGGYPQHSPPEPPTRTGPSTRTGSPCPSRTRKLRTGRRGVGERPPPPQPRAKTAREQGGGGETDPTPSVCAKRAQTGREW